MGVKGYMTSKSFVWLEGFERPTLTILITGGEVGIERELFRRDYLNCSS